MDVASEDYGSYLIVSVATPDQLTGAWSLYVYICRSRDYQITKKIEERRQFESKEKAHVFGVKRACEWIDSEKSGDLLRQLQAINRELQAQIIERDLAVETANENERLFRSFVESAPDATVITDHAGHIALTNGQTERLFGYDRLELAGKSVEILIPQRFVANHQEHRAAFTKNPRVRPMGMGMQLYAIRKNGSEFPVEISLSPFDAKDGVLTIAAIRDVTERIEIERRLQEKERLATIGATAAAFGHEIANPLGGLSTSIDVAKRLLTQSPGTDPLVLETLETASSEIERLIALLKNYRDVSRPQRLKLELSDCRTVIEEVLASQTHHYRQLGVAVEIQFDERLPSIRLDRDKMKQVILNICQNAVDAMPEGGTLTVSARRLQDRAVIAVQDSGTGIAKDLDVFQPFTTTKREGMGLGLSIVRQIVTAHRGTVDYVSEIGKGTTFRIWVPIKK
jgi:two-component system, LuxR family, sensor kinase FixL